MKLLPQYRIKALLFIIAIISIALTVCVVRPQSLDNIRRLEHELELVLNDPEFKAVAICDGTVIRMKLAGLL